MRVDGLEKYVVLGCGYLGFHLAQYFNLLKNEVIVVGRTSYYTGKLHSAIQFYEADLFDIDSYKALLTVDCIVIHAVNHINATNSFADLDKDVKYNYLSFIRLINTCEEINIKKFVFLSSAGTIYGNSTLDLIDESQPIAPVNIYGLQKVYFEKLLQIKMLESENFPYVSLRISNPYGGDQDPKKKQGIIPILIRKAFSGDDFELWANRKTTRDFIYIDDLLKATGDIIQSHFISGEEINIGSGQGTSLEELIIFIEKSTGKKIKVVGKAVSTTAIQSNVLDISKMVKLVGFKPEISIKEGIDRIVHQMKRILL